MAVRRPAFRSSPSNPFLGAIQTVPERIKDMPYAPAIRVEAPGDLLFISGATPSPLYHKHPHELSEHKHPISIADQTRLAMARACPCMKGPFIRIKACGANVLTARTGQEVSVSG